MGFLEATRQNFTMLPSQAYTGQRLYFTLPKVGLLSKLILGLSGTMTCTIGGHSIAVDAKTAFNFIRRIRLIANSGAAIYDVTGYGTYLINNISRFGNSPDNTLIDRGTVDTDVYAAGVSEGANAWKMALEIPIAINERDPIGLIMLQNAATQLTLEVEFNDVYSTTAGVAALLTTADATAAFTAGVVSVMMEYFTVPKDPKDYPSLNVVHQWLEQRDSVTAVGAFTKAMQRGNTYMRIMHALTLNGALNTTAIDRLRLIYNQSEVPYNIDKLQQLLIQRNRYGYDLPLGTFVHDFYFSNGLVGLGNSRDFINSANVTEFQSEVTINSAATLGSGTNFLDTITEQLIRVA